MNLATQATLEEIDREKLEAPETCDNCHKALYRIRGGEIFCHPCDQINRADVQIWKCQVCSTKRVYGLDSPAETSVKQLNCIACEETTAHVFVYVSRRRSAQEPCAR